MAIPVTAEYVSVLDAGKLIGLHERSVWALLSDKDDPIPTYKIGRRRLIKVADLREWMERRRTEVPPSKVERIVEDVMRSFR
jgi:excisionase family DNA binding protein